MQLHSPLYQQWACQELVTPFLAGVPTCAGECRFVRVIRVLDPSRSRPCVTAVLAAAAGQPPRPRRGPGVPARGSKTGRRR